MLLDILLPDLDGFEVLERIRALEPPIRDIPVILVSGCTPTPVYAERANTLEAVDLLTKPVPLQKFLEVVVRQSGEAKPVAPAARSKPAPRREPGVSGTFDRINCERRRSGTVFKRRVLSWLRSEWTARRCS